MPVDKASYDGMEPHAIITQLERENTSLRIQVLTLTQHLAEMVNIIRHTNRQKEK